MIVLLDTHVWVWWNDDPAKIPAAVRRTVARAGAANELFLSAISPWEVALLVEKKRLGLAGDVLAWINSALEVPGLTLYPLVPSIAVLATRLPFTLHGDPADRIIAATALELGALLLTKDERLLDASGLNSRWA